MFRRSSPWVTNHTIFMLVTEINWGVILLCQPVQPVFSELVPNDPPEWMSGWAPTSMWWDRWTSRPAMNSPSRRAPTCLVSVLGRSQLTERPNKTTTESTATQWCSEQLNTAELGVNVITIHHKWSSSGKHEGVSTPVYIGDELWWLVTHHLWIIQYI